MLAKTASLLNRNRCDALFYNKPSLFRKDGKSTSTLLEALK